jgi:hypothetical protein
MQRATLILRYGVGPVHARSASETARLLGVSPARVALLEHRGVGSLAGRSRRSGCGRTGVATATLAPVYGLLAEASIASLAGAAAALTDPGRGDVAGVRASGGERQDGPQGPADGDDENPASPSFGAPLGEGNPVLGDPLFLVLLAVVVACLASAARDLRRSMS